METTYSSKSTNFVEMGFFCGSENIILADDAIENLKRGLHVRGKYAAPARPVDYNQLQGAKKCGEGAVQCIMILYIMRDVDNHFS